MRSSHELEEILDIGHHMKRAGLPADFIIRAIGLAREARAAYGLLRLWWEEDSPEEQRAIVAELEGLLAAGNEERLLRKATDSSAAAQAFTELTVEAKRRLRDQVEVYGGITKLARETGIAQPYLSRLFNSAVKPRHATLQKIYKALGV